MKRPDKETIKVKYDKRGNAEIASVIKQYSILQDEYIDYLESKLEDVSNQLQCVLTR